MQKDFVRELLADQYPAQKIANITAEQFQLAQVVGTIQNKSEAKTLYIGKLAIANEGVAYTGSLSIEANNTLKPESIQHIIKDGQAALELDGLVFSTLTTTYTGTDVPGTRLSNLIFSGYKVTLV
jgi:hypothetical protein